VAVAGGAIWVSEGRRGRVHRIDPATNQVVARIQVRSRPCELIGDDERVWVVSDFGDYLEGIDVETNEVVTRLRGDRGRGKPALGEGEVWWSNDTQNQSVTRYEAATGRVIARVKAGSIEAGPTDLARGAGSVWVGNEDGTVQRIRTDTNEVAETIEAGPRPAFLLFHGDALWFANLGERTLRRLDPQSNRITHVLEGGGGDMATDGASLWTVGANDKTVDGKPERPVLFRFDSARPALTERIEVGPTREGGGGVEQLAPLEGVAVGAGAVWVTSTVDGNLYRIDPRR
jgi:DNA-binding beta-propeller fold protein YncE